MGKRHADTEVQYELTPKRPKPINTSNGDCGTIGKADNYVLTREIVDGAILTDLYQKTWRVGRPIGNLHCSFYYLFCDPSWNWLGKGSFGEIFLASNNTSRSVTSENAAYVVKIEPHSNGPLFVEIHCLLNASKTNGKLMLLEHKILPLIINLIYKLDDQSLPPGMPEYIASGSHFFNGIRYRFLILKRFDCDLSSIVKRNGRIETKQILIIASQIVDVLEHLHDKGYAHSDIKAENLMIGKYMNKNVANREVVRETRKKCIRSRKNIDKDFCKDDFENSDDDSSTISGVCESEEGLKTPVRLTRRLPARIQYSGSNPVRSCRVGRKNSIYDDMVKSHYLRPPKRINYCVLADGDDDEDDDDDCDNEHEDRTWNAKTSKTVDRLQRRTSSCSSDSMVDRIFLIDFGLASKFVDTNGVHRPFCMDQRRAHDGTLEFTSRDAHMGAHSRRSDLECLAYNLLYWSEGSLPWKDERLSIQPSPDQVHHMKEFFMTDVRGIFKQIYGRNVPTYLAEYMDVVIKLAYDERPDYNLCRQIFGNELKRLGYTMDFNVNELKRGGKWNADDPKTPVNLENIVFKDVKSMMKLCSTGSTKKKTNGASRISPKNLRSKSEKLTKKQRAKFSWTDILSTDPDQIARQRAEKEYDRHQSDDTPVLSRYTGRPTYAILEVENRIKFKDRLVGNKDECEKADTEHMMIKGYTKPMMDIVRKRQSALLEQYEEEDASNCEDTSEETSHSQTSNERPKRNLRKVAARKIVFDKTIQSTRLEFSSTDESSCSSNASVQQLSTGRRNRLQMSQQRRRRYNSSCGMSSPVSDDDDEEDNSHDRTEYNAMKCTANNRRYVKSSLTGRRNKGQRRPGGGKKLNMIGKNNETVINVGGHTLRRLRTIIRG